MAAQGGITTIIANPFMSIDQNYQESPKPYSLSLLQQRINKIKSL